MLYHYTHPKVIMSIIREEGVILRFSRYDCLNDTSEGKEAVAIQQEACEALKAEYAGNDVKLQLLERIAELRPDFRSIYVEDRGYHTVSAVPYICSFSRERDALTMWNYYTKGTHYEGYNVGIEVEGLCLEVFDPDRQDPAEHGSGPAVCLPGGTESEACFSDGNGCGCCDSGKPELKCEWWSVVYDRQQQADTIRNEIERILSSGSFSENEYVALLNNWAIRFKNEIFRHEKEERLVCYVPEDAAHNDADLDDFIQFRVVNGCLVPYLDVLISDKSALKEIAIGPLIEDQLAVNTMELFLRLKGYSGVKLYTSKAPIRY